MKDQIQIIVDFILAGAGFLAVLAVMVSAIASLVYLVVGLNEKDPKKRKSNFLKALLWLLIPPALLIFILLAYALVNTLLA